MVSKRKKFILVLISVIAVIFTVLAVNSLLSYMKINYILDKGIKISSFSAENRNKICSYFDITANDTLEFVSLEYRKNLKDICTELQIKLVDKTKVSEILLNYSISEEVYSPLSFEGKFSEDYELLSEQYVNSKNSHMRAYTFSNGENIILLILCDRETDYSLKEYVYNQVKVKNFEKLN